MLAQESKNHLYKNMSDDERAKAIKNFIIAEEGRLRDSHPWLFTQQNALGLATCLGACAGMMIMGYLYVKGISPWWLTLVVSGYLAGILNEVEHDLMHYIYFKGKESRWINNIMMIMVWAFRGNYMNPWNRRKIHLHHHATSGSKMDIETRMTGLGTRFTLFRYLLMMDVMWVFLIKDKLNKDTKGFYKSGETFIHMIPFTWIFFSLWLSLIILTPLSYLNSALGLNIPFSEGLLAYQKFLNIAFVVYLGPSIIRTAALHIISSNTHYSGEKLHLVRQVQSFDPWYFKILQPFCFNFGKTHVIHHFVVDQTYYVRQLISRPVLKFMEEYGVNVNDHGTFRRLNRFSQQPSKIA